MKNIEKARGPQGSNRKTRTRKVAHIAHPPGPVRRKKKQTPQSSTSGHTGGDDNETHEEGTLLPPFDLKARVVAETGLLDHLEVSAKHGYVSGSHDEIDLFRLYAGAAPQDFKTEDTSKRYGKLFKVAPHNGRKGLPLAIRKTKTIWGGNPLPAPSFSGLLNTQRIKTGEDQFVCNISTYLHLNPTHGLNLCPSLASADALTWEEAILSRRPEVELTKGLDGKDNVIAGNLLVPANYFEISRSFNAVYAGIESELRRASKAADEFPMLGTIRTEEFSLRRVETYWEFSAPDAVALVKKLAPSLRVFHRHNRDREHGSDFETIGNSPTITLFLSKGESVRVYAKMANRIRFEVIHSPKKQNGLIPGGYSAPTLKICVEKLHLLRKKAELRVNQVLAFLSEWADETPQDRASASRYASQWFQRLGFSEASERLLELLRVNGRIVAGQYLPKDERDTRRRAEEKGLVAYDEHACAFYPMSFGTVLPISGHSLTDGVSVPTNSGHKTETHPVVSVPNSPTPIRKRSGQVGVPPCPPLLKETLRRSAQEVIFAETPRNTSKDPENQGFEGRKRRRRQQRAM